MFAGEANLTQIVVSLVLESRLLHIICPAVKHRHLRRERITENGSNLIVVLSILKQIPKKSRLYCYVNYHLVVIS